MLLSDLSFIFDFLPVIDVKKKKKINTIRSLDISYCHLQFICLEIVWYLIFNVLLFEIWIK